MTYAVAFDDGDLSRAALRRAVEFAGQTDVAVVAVTAVPTASGYVRDRG